LKTWDKIIHYPKIGVILLAYVAFVALGMPDGLLGVAWPSIRASFSVPLDAVALLMFISAGPYLASSFLSGVLISRWGVGRLLAISCALTGVGLFGFTIAPQWWIMVSMSVLTGFGAGAIDSGLNAYVAANLSEGQMQWLHASYGVGITLGPIIMTLSLSNFDSWRAGYRIVAAFQFFMALCFALTLPMWKSSPAADKQDKVVFTEYKTPMSATLRQPRVWLSAALFFLYVGAEVSLGTWAYTLLTESRGVDPTAAGFITGSYWATFTIGRFLAGILTRKAGIHRMVLGGAGFALTGALLLLWNPFPLASLVAVAIIGLAIAPIFPAMMSGTSLRVSDRFASNTIGIEMAASSLGNLVITSLMGVLARRVSLEVIPVCLVIVFTGLISLYRLSMRPQKVQGNLI
jgi:fucose permease